MLGSFRLQSLFKAGPVVAVVWPARNCGSPSRFGEEPMIE
jgi:hypothetical protein